mmetsp:Transcript_12769/g.16343  ORF Transcript_12769/g.16343 Transcript_12769/m.16343 type:complete len:344 (-) Transcript_12769:29-1060(-)
MMHCSASLVVLSVLVSFLLTSLGTLFGLLIFSHLLLALVVVLLAFFVLAVTVALAVLNTELLLDVVHGILELVEHLRAALGGRRQELGKVPVVLVAPEGELDDGVLGLVLDEVLQGTLGDCSSVSELGGGARRLRKVGVGLVVGEQGQDRADVLNDVQHGADAHSPHEVVDLGGDAEYGQQLRASGAAHDNQGCVVTKDVAKFPEIGVSLLDLASLELTVFVVLEHGNSDVERGAEGGHKVSNLGTGGVFPGIFGRLTERSLAISPSIFVAIHLALGFGVAFAFFIDRLLTITVLDVAFIFVTISDGVFGGGVVDGGVVSRAGGAAGIVREDITKRHFRSVVY